MGKQNLDERCACRPARVGNVFNLQPDMRPPLAFLEKLDTHGHSPHESFTNGYFTYPSSDVVNSVKVLAEEVYRILAAIASLEKDASSISCGLQYILKVMTLSQSENLSTQDSDNFWDFFYCKPADLRRWHDNVQANTKMRDLLPGILETGVTSSYVETNDVGMLQESTSGNAGNAFDKFDVEMCGKDSGVVLGFVSQSAMHFDDLIKASHKNTGLHKSMMDQSCVKVSALYSMPSDFETDFLLAHLNPDSGFVPQSVKVCGEGKAMLIEESKEDKTIQMCNQMFTSVNFKSEVESASYTPFSWAHMAGFFSSR